MNGLTNLDTVYLALAFFVPGFVMSSVRNQFITGKERQGTEQFIRFLTNSAINYAVFGGFIYWVLSVEPTIFWKSVLWACVLLVCPAAIGLVSGAGVQHGWFRKLYHFFGLKPVHVVPTAWDFKFGNMQGEWVLIVLKDGTQFAGFCGERSFASSDSKERDLFIQSVFSLDENDKWAATEKSLFVAAGEIRTIEFWPVKQENCNDQQSQPTLGDAQQVNFNSERPPAPTGSVEQATGRPPTVYRTGSALESAESGYERQPQKMNI